MKGHPLILVKLGGSLITDKAAEETPQLGVLARLAREIARARPAMADQILLGHGSGSFGHRAAQRYRITEGLREEANRPGVSLTQAAAARLHRLVCDALAAAGAEPWSLAPSSFLVTWYGRPREIATAPLFACLESGLLPVVYGDVVLDRGQGVAIASTEMVLLSLAARLLRKGYSIERAIWVGATPGVHDPHGHLLPEVSPKSWRALRPAIDGAAGTDVTGGIRLRLDTCFTLARMGIPSLILDGREEHRLERALLGEEVPGTRIATP